MVWNWIVVNSYNYKCLSCKLLYLVWMGWGGKWIVDNCGELSIFEIVILWVCFIGKKC